MKELYTQEILKNKQNRYEHITKRERDMQIKDKQISYSLRKPFDLIDSLNEKTPPKIEGVAIGDANLTTYE